jgi:hypothetical protein
LPSIIDIAKFQYVQPAFLYFMLYLAIPLALVAIYFARPGRLAEVRKLPLMTHMEEVIGSCAERGLPFIWSYTRDVLQPRWGALEITYYARMFKHISRLAGNAAVPVYFICDNPQVLMIMQDYSREGFVSSAHPEQYDARNYYFVSGLLAFYSETVLLMQGHNAGGIVVAGGFLSNAGPVFEEAYRTGAISIALGTGGGQAGPAFMADYQKMSDEHLACGAWADPDPKTGAAIVGSDVAKIMSAALVVFLIILAATGVRF